MPPLNWHVFEGLPGSVETNFEMLCRGVVQRNYGKDGVFRARAQQPGVEFHLRLQKSCGLGEPGRWYGWQSRWYQLDPGRPLGKNRRAKIEKAIKTTHSVLPNLTDWVLWTRYPLTAGDQQWFGKLSTHMNLHLWTGADVEGLLSGDAAILRSTYFGELVFTPDLLQTWHEKAVAPIKRRWQPEVHQAVDAERALRRMLGESGSWDDLPRLAETLQAEADAARKFSDLPEDTRALVNEVANVADSTAAALGSIDACIGAGDIDLLHEELSVPPASLSSDAPSVVRQLRSANHIAGLLTTNVVGALRQAAQLRQRVRRAFGECLVAVVAPAGSGKTQLAAQLTTRTPDRPHGVLLQGRDLHKGQTLDDLARRIIVAGQPIPSMEALLAAVDAAGQRAGHRLPIVLDGINEAEDPREWRPLIASLQTTLTSYPYVLFVCTVRPEFEKESVPPEVARLDMPGLADDVTEAIPLYFQHYKIDSLDAPLPIGLLRHPLTLRLFCEVTNPKREETVGLEAIPGSLTALFDRYCEQSAERIAELSPLKNRYYEQDVRVALDRVGAALWDRGARSLEIGELRQLLGDDGRPWDQSIVRALEQEGILLRVSGDGPMSSVAPVYDALGGHLVASALLARHGQAGLEPWLRQATTETLLADPVAGRHPLATDVVNSLVGQVPRRLHSRQLWQMVNEPLRTVALRLAANLEGPYLDGATVRELIALARQPRVTRPDLLERFLDARGSENHPLNAEALDEVLRTMRVSDRDLRWSEWLRREQEAIMADLDSLEQRWRKGRQRSGDALRARWIMWTLTSTVRRLRDQATRTLYWYGRHDPTAMFTLTLDSLGVNDPYVGERMLAASYGIVMAHQLHDAKFEDALGKFLVGLADAMIGATAATPSTHYLARTYVGGIVDFAKRFYDPAVPDKLRNEWAFASPAPIDVLDGDDVRAREVDRTLHMDFRNYTIGRLFEDRDNYDMSHAAHNTAVAHIRSEVWWLGWREGTFGDLDRRIDEGHFHTRVSRAPAERYGKKYGWIGFFEYAGMLEEQRRLPHDNRRLSDVDIDPSFPERARVDITDDIGLSWVSPAMRDDAEWIRMGHIDVPKQVFVRECIGEDEGPWVAVHGFVEAGNRVLGRKVFGFISALVATHEGAGQLSSALKAGVPCPSVSSSVPSDYYTFAGEIPWSPAFALGWEGDTSDATYRDRVGMRNGGGAEVEILAHDYGWESYHSEMNQAGGARVPSRPFSARFDLRSLPQSFDQALPDGSRATITLSGVDGLEGDLLYVREDLLRQYVGDREVLWLVWGERQMDPYPSSPPDWLSKAREDQADSWRVVRTEEEIRG